MPSLYSQLLYICAIQIRQNTASLKASSHHAITDSFNAINVKIVEDPATARLWHIGHSDQSRLNEDEQVQYALLSPIVYAYFRNPLLPTRSGHNGGAVIHDRRKKHSPGLLNSPGLLSGGM